MCSNKMHDDEHRHIRFNATSRTRVRERGFYVLVEPEVSVLVLASKSPPKLHKLHLHNRISRVSKLFSPPIAPIGCGAAVLMSGADGVAMETGATVAFGSRQNEAGASADGEESRRVKETGRSRREEEKTDVWF